MKKNDMELRLAGRLANLWECFYIEADNFKGNRRACPYYSEARGFEMALTEMAIAFDFTFKEFNGEYRISKVKIGKHCVPVKCEW